MSVNSTAEKLLDAAAKEFNEHGFHGTDTNKIARRAGFAPQTFYRWFKGKDAIFIQTYERWTRDEFTTLRKLLARNASDGRLAQAIVAHHKAYLLFRRSLRQLSVEKVDVRSARARRRLAQLEFVQSLSPGDTRDKGALAAMLLQTERLADALAEGEFRDMGLSKSAGEEALTRLIRGLLGRVSKGSMQC